MKRTDYVNSINTMEFFVSQVHFSFEPYPLFYLPNIRKSVIVDAMIEQRGRMRER